MTYIWWTYEASTPLPYASEDATISLQAALMTYFTPSDLYLTSISGPTIRII